MKVLNVCSILPLEGLRPENDISIKIQQEINKVDDTVEFVFLKCIPYSNSLLAKLKPLWFEYFNYIKKKEIIVSNYKAFIFPWFRLPTSNFKVDRYLLFFNNLFLLKNTEKILSNEIRNVDLIISQNNNADGVVAHYLSKKYGIPHIHVLRGEMNDDIFNAKYIQKILSHAKLCITPSPTINNFFKKNNMPIELLAHGIDEEYFYRGQKDTAVTKFVVVARLLSLKNIDLVIKTLAKAKKLNLSFEFTIVGDGPERESLEELTSKLNLNKEIKFTGWLSKEDVIDKMVNANVMIMPSFPETLGRVYLEAAAAKCLCVAHKGSGIDGLFIDNESAIFCEPADIESKIIDIIKKINSDEYSNILTKSLAIANELKWSSITHRYLELFKSVMK